MVPSCSTPPPAAVPADGKVRCGVAPNCEGRSVIVSVTTDEAVSFVAVRRLLAEHLRVYSDWQAQLALRSLSEALERLT